MTDQRYPSTRKKWRCKCPGCGRNHFLRINWTGNGTPRFFCTACAGTAELFDNTFMPLCGLATSTGARTSSAAPAEA